ncbi:MAG: DUF86 domain-containing protein [Candidatus Pacearchaeota archaeon]|jgi:uncharacterized protein YutE (UPF0331/DUF86 family)
MEKQSIKKRINDKTLEIESFREQLSEIIPESIELEDYKKDFKTKAIFERYAEKIIEAIEDLAFLVVNYKGLRYPEFEKEIFDILYENKIISEILAKKLKGAKGMRNIIAHQYGSIDDEIVFVAITEQLGKDVSEFIDLIEKAIK